MRGMVGMIAVVALLVACGSEREASQASGPALEAATGNAAAVPVAQPVPATPAKPAPGEIRIFADWAVGCDNLGSCKAAALAPEGGDFPAVLMSVSRGGGPGGAVTLAFLSSEAIPLPLQVAVDGKAVGEGGRTDDDATRIEGEPARAILAAAANGRALSVADGGRAASSTISLAGLAAALRYIDAQQGRAGTVGALVARGPAPDRRPAPAAPIVVAVAAGGRAAVPSARQLAELRQAGSCEDDIAANSAAAPETHALGGGKTLLLLPCSMGAYNVIALVYVGDARGFRPAEFDSEAGMGEAGAVPDVVNGQWEGGLLTGYAKGRGLGDCGVSSSFAWDGSRFRLVEQAAMPECRGNTDYIRTWKATVRRG